jgi:hypothetical protein
MKGKLGKRLVLHQLRSKVQPVINSRLNLLPKCRLPLPVRIKTR